LEPAHRELVDKVFSPVQTSRSADGGPLKPTWSATGSLKGSSARDPGPPPELSEGERFATDALVAQGVWPQAAQELVVKHGAGHCLHYVEALPYQEGVKNPADLQSIPKPPTSRVKRLR
jgi:hypothetical protein